MHIYEPSWLGTDDIANIRYVCGFCGTLTGPQKGYRTIMVSKRQGFVLICTYCNRPTFVDFLHGKIASTIPSARMGRSINGLPPDVEAVYEEARLCTSAGAYTAAVMLCRKLLMHTAIGKEAEAGKSFLYYVKYLNEKNLIPPGGEEWVDYIRKKGNEANHEIVETTAEDAEKLIALAQMLLIIVYEFEQLLPKKDNPEALEK